MNDDIASLRELLDQVQRNKISQTAALEQIIDMLIHMRRLCEPRGDQ